MNSTLVDIELRNSSDSCIRRVKRLQQPQFPEMLPATRDAVPYIVETFPIIKRNDINRTTISDKSCNIVQSGTYICDAMNESIRTGIPDETRLDPPLGPPKDLDGNFVPIFRWDSSSRLSPFMLRDINELKDSVE